MSCACFFNDPGSVYPVIDPLRVAGELPHHYGYGFALDGVEVIVEDDPALSRCQMLVGLSTQSSQVWATKEIIAWNYCTGSGTSSVVTSGVNRGPNFMLVQKSNCHAGADTLLLRKAMTFDIMTPLYTLQSNNLWAFWGGKRVTFRWAVDDAGSGLWGPNTSASVLPGVRFPDGTLVRSSAQPGVVFVVFGGAKFEVTASAAALGLNLGQARLEAPSVVNKLPSASVDFTLLRELSKAEVFVIFGGAKFWITSPASLTSLGFHFGQVRVVPDGALSKIPSMPRNGTLLREENNAKVFLVKAGALCWVTSPSVFHRMCLFFQNVRVVSANVLTALPQGPDLT